MPSVRRFIQRSDEWTRKVNKYRTERLKKELEKKGVETPIDLTTFTYPIFDNIPNKKEIKPKYKVGDMVYVLYNEPHKFSKNANGEDTKQNTKSFRVGDLRLSKKKYKISKVLYYSGNIMYRYMLDGYPSNRKQSASFTENELRN